MELNAVEVRSATLKTTAKVGGGRITTTVMVRAPLTTEIAETLGCRKAVFTETIDLRPQPFRTLTFDIDEKPMCLHIELDGIAKREITVDEVEASAVIIENEDGVLASIIKLIVRGPAASTSHCSTLPWM